MRLVTCSPASISDRFRLWSGGVEVSICIAWGESVCIVSGCIEPEDSNGLLVDMMLGGCAFDGLCGVSGGGC
jgi:hypothetical protein